MRVRCKDCNWCYYDDDIDASVCMTGDCFIIPIEWVECSVDTCDDYESI